MEDIHLAVLEVLERTGIKVHSNEGLALSKGRGEGEGIGLDSIGSCGGTLRRLLIGSHCANGDGSRSVFWRITKVFYGRA